MKHALLFLLLAGLYACARNPAPVPLYGDPGALPGDWRGQYTSSESGRSGSIAFRLEAGRDTAFGDVLMIVPRGPQDVPSFHPAGTWQGAAADARPLRIRFVQVSADGVRGRLDPYPDPACGCTVETTFEGVLAGDVIGGTFTTRRVGGGHVQHGVWRVRRR